MPISSRRVSTGDMVYPNVFLGPVDHTFPVEVDPSDLDNVYVDARGYLKPGAPLATDGTLVGAGDTVVGVNVEAFKVAASNSNADLAAAAVVRVAVAAHCMVNRGILEDVLGRALTSDEVAGFEGTTIVLVGDAGL
jgi:hypothetical protein